MNTLTILIDTREQAPLKFATFPTEPATLATGDYSVQGLEDSITIERKSISDLIGSLTSGRERFQREIQRMLAYRSRTLLIVGDGTDP
jgi:ERCC4-type nuclease